MLDLITAPNDTATDQEMQLVLEAQADDLARLNRAHDFDALVVAFVARGFVLRHQAGAYCELDLPGAESPLRVEIDWCDREVAFLVVADVGRRTRRVWHYDFDSPAETVASLLGDLPGFYVARLAVPA